MFSAVKKLLDPKAFAQELVRMEIEWQALREMSRHGDDAAIVQWVGRNRGLLKQMEEPRDECLPMAVSGRCGAAAIDALIAAGANLNAVDPVHGETVVHLAVKGDKPFSAETLVCLLRAGGPALRDLPDQEGRTPLMTAVANDTRQAVDILLGSGADREALDDKHRTALLIAVEAAKAELIRRLLDAGAALVADHGRGRSAMVAAAVAGHVAVVDLLLERGIGIDLPDGSGTSALQGAAMAGRAAMVQALVERGASVHRVDTEGRTPLMYAAMGGDRQTVEMLLGYGAVVRAATVLEGRTALHLAAAAGSEGAIEALLAAGARVNEPDAQGCTPLLLAVDAGHREAARTLQTVYMAKNIPLTQREKDLMPHRSMLPLAPGRAVARLLERGEALRVENAALARRNTALQASQLQSDTQCAVLTGALEDAMARIALLESRVACANPAPAGGADTVA